MQTVSTTTPTPIQAESTTAFINSLGYDAPIGDIGTSYATDFSDIISDLQYLGVDHIRTGAKLDLSVSSTSYAGVEDETLAAAGIKLDLVVDDTETVAYYIANFNLLEEKDPGSIASIEGENEILPANVPTYQAFQTQLYAAVRADPLLNNVPVTGFSILSLAPSDYTSIDNDSLEDEGALHSYTEWLPPNDVQSWASVLYTSDSPGQSYATTETGYDTDTALPAAGTLGEGVDQTTQAKEELSDFFDLIMDGSTVVYMYQLLDLSPDPGDTSSEYHFGQFTTNNAPKLVATVMHNLSTILADPGATASTFTPGTLSYAISGLNSNINPTQLESDFQNGNLEYDAYYLLPTYGYSYLMEKSSGVFDLAVWAEPIIWDPITQTEVTAPVIPVTITLGVEAASVEVYDPMVGTSPIATYTDVTTVSVSVVDHPLIIEIDPFPATTATTTSTTSTTTTSTTTTSSSTTTSTSTPFTVTTVVNGSVVSPPTSPTTSTGTTVVGSGADTIALTMSEDAYSGDAQFVVLVNGKQVGGTLTVTAQLGLGQSQVFDIEGAFNSGTNSVQVVYLNDLYGGTSATDRNLYLLGASYNASTTAASAILAPSSEDALLSNGSFTFTANTAVPGPTTIGSGADLLQLTMSEQADAGDAQFQVYVDGVQIGGTQTVTANAAEGETQVFNVMGTFGAASEDVSIVMVNPNSTAGYPVATRTLYVDSAVLDGNASQPLADSTMTLTSSTSPDNFSITHTATPATELGSGADTLALFLAEDAYSGDAQFTVSVNGQQVGGTMTESELHGSGQAQELDILGTFTPGATNTVSVDFLNDAYGGSSSLDRNLYVDAAAINGNTIAGSTYEINNTGSLGFSFVTPNTAGVTTIGGAGADTLALSMSEDYFQANAQFTVSVDGKQVGGVQTVTAINGNGQSQVFDISGSFSGSHTVSVNFLNDASSSPYTADLDRNLYVGGATIDGTAIASSTLSLLSSGAKSFTFTH